MRGELLAAAKRALESLVGRLDPADAFGLVVFDDDVLVPVPAGRLADKAAALEAIRGVSPGGMTNLSGGYLRGLQEARRVTGAAGATVVLLSDGHANAGILDRRKLEGVAAAGRQGGMTTATIGLGLDYDDRLLSALASGGAGGHHFALDGDAAGAALAQEVDHLLARVAQAVSLVIRPASSVPGFTLWNDLPVAGLEDGVMVELGDFHSGEQRSILLGFDVPGMPALGAVSICELELRWVDIASMTEKVATLPVNVNVVPGDAAAGRVPVGKVRDELAFLKLQRTKRAAADRLSEGDAPGAAAMMRGAADDAGRAPSSALREEAAVLRRLADEATERDPRVAAKTARADWHAKTRRRG
jgi:Ca-activated chloride channel family protein